MTALEACRRARSAWERTQPQYTLFDPYDVLRRDAATPPPDGISSEGVGFHRSPTDGCRASESPLPARLRGDADTPPAWRGPTQPSIDQDQRSEEAK